MMEIEIRDIHLGDIHERYDSLLRTLAPLSEIKLSRQALAEIHFNRQHAGIRTIIAVLEDEIIGAGSVILEEKFIHDGGRVAHIEDVSVSESYQSCGVGKDIMKTLLGIAREAGCYKVILNCAAKNIGFYETLGFVKHGVSMRLNLEEVP